MGLRVWGVRNLGFRVEALSISNFGGLWLEVPIVLWGFVRSLGVKVWFRVQAFGSSVLKARA